MSQSYSQLFDQLNAPQRNAVMDTEGPSLIIAGAGSGKTRVLTYRIANLLNKGISPLNIVALTFTNKAASEMKERILGLVGNNSSQYIWAGTFHSIFARMLRFEYKSTPFPSNFTIYDTADAVSAMKSTIKELNLNKEDYKPKQILGRVSEMKNNLITPEDYSKDEYLLQQDKNINRPAFSKIYSHYQLRCLRAGAMDFDDLLLQTYLLLKRDELVLQKYQNKFRYILVDEFQDINQAQYHIVKMLADKFQNICVVGDDAQSIYAFRGANIQHILNFKKNFNANQYRLEQNYRSTKNIVNVANSLIEKNKSQIKKKLFTDNEQGNKVRVVELENEYVEAEYLAKTIKALSEATKGVVRYPFSQFGILYRTNAQSRVIEDSLKKARINHRIYGGISFYQRSEIKDVLAYLKLIVNPIDDEAFKRVVNRPSRGIGQTTMNRLIVISDEFDLPLYETIKKIDYRKTGISMALYRKLQSFVSLIGRSIVDEKTKNAHEIAKSLVNQTKIIDFIKEKSESEEIGLDKKANIDELLNSIKEFVDRKKKEQPDEVPSLGEYLQEVVLLTSQDNDDFSENHVRLMTVHLSKGLEFPFVFVTGLEQDIFPSALNSVTPKDLEEERRLLYVAITRAEKKLFLTRARYRYRHGNLQLQNESSFIHELDKEYLSQVRDFSKGRKYDDIRQQSIFDRQPLQYSKTNRPKSIEPTTYNRPNGQYRKLEGEVSSSVSNKRYPDLKVGSRVEHSSFGLGRIISFSYSGENQIALIDFEDGTEVPKKILLSYAKLKIL